MRSRRASTHDLRSAIDSLPRETREAMLDGVLSEHIIVGAYVDRNGGVCPMLAAHRRGERIDFLPFSRAWDRYTHATRARRASRRELHVLIAHLEASLFDEEFAHVDLAEAIAEHRSLAARARVERLRARRDAEPRRVRPGDPDRSRELGRRSGWSWLRPFRRLDDYERAIAGAQAQQEQLSERSAEREPATLA
jgi:hypothetical protein